LSTNKSRIFSLLFCALCIFWCDFWFQVKPRAQQPGSADVDFFREKILPILSSRCQSCHSDTLKLSGLTLESSEGLRTGGAHGPVVVSGNPGLSRLYRRVARLEKPYMPMEGAPLSRDEVAWLKTWIERGAVWPESIKPDKAHPTANSSAANAQNGTATPGLSANAILFQERISPILSARCLSCHNEERKYSGLSLESLLGFQNGGWHGPVVAPGKPEESRLYRVLARLEKPYMPLSPTGGPGEPLPEEEVNQIKRWIEAGAEWPMGAKAGQAEEARLAKLEELRKLENRPITAEERQWWAFQKPVRPAIPKVKGQADVRNPIDAFILSALEAKGLRPAPLASRRTLIRRVYFDLIGLPPKPEEMEAFLNDPSPEAYGKLVNRLLDSERYGERWARHWLDVVRYADSDGYEYDRLRPNSWRYRDYVIRSFNQDKPYNRFVREQLAGDELPDRDYDSVVALGFCRNGPFIGDMVLMQNEMTRQDELDDMVTATGAAFLGLTVGCARCHNHKYDPIAQKDYYRLVAVFSPSVRANLPLAPPAIAQAYERQVQEIDRKIDALAQQIRVLQKPTLQRLLDSKYRELPEPLQIAIRTGPAKRTEAQKRQAEQVITSTSVTEAELLAALGEEDRRKTEELKAQIAELEKTKPQPLPVAMAITDPTPTPSKSYFLHRGSILSKGSEMEPGVPEVLAPPGADVRFPQPCPGARTTGRRLALANWLASEENPLAARVMVNRLWQHHFGKGLVGTPNDFGRMGEAPSHPELLDWLATEFVRQGWSIKAMHRLMLTSRTYQQSSTFTDAANLKKDPENRLLWKMRLHRLEGEIIRDSILAVSGALNLKAGGPGIFPEVDAGLIESSPKEAAQLLYQRWPVTRDGPEVWRRSIYVTQMRTVTAPIMDLFDPPESVSSCPKRNTTTVAPQALQLLNNKFVAGQSFIFAERLWNEVGKDRPSQIQRAFRLAFGRLPEPPELQDSLAFLKKQEGYHRTYDLKLLAGGVDPAEIPLPEKAALMDLCHSLFNSNEFIYLN
jgi:Protein of unknown function (DUF1553)/Protein of unknown function (DUF1549)/Planctomycete cytochrome C